MKTILFTNKKINKVIAKMSILAITASIVAEGMLFTPINAYAMETSPFDNDILSDSDCVIINQNDDNDTEEGNTNSDDASIPADEGTIINLNNCEAQENCEGQENCKEQDTTKIEIEKETETDTDTNTDTEPDSDTNTDTEPDSDTFSYIADIANEDQYDTDIENIDEYNTYVYPCEDPNDEYPDNYYDTVLGEIDGAEVCITTDLYGNVVIEAYEEAYQTVQEEGIYYDEYTEEYVTYVPEEYWPEPSQEIVEDIKESLAKNWDRNSVADPLGYVIEKGIGYVIKDETANIIVSNTIATTIEFFSSGASIVSGTVAVVDVVIDAINGKKCTAPKVITATLSLIPGGRAVGSIIRVAFRSKKCR